MGTALVPRQKQPITQQGYDKLSEEREQLREQLKSEPKRVDRGNQRDDAFLTQQLHESTQVTMKRIREITEILEKSEIHHPSANCCQGVVEFGCRVLLRDQHGEYPMTILGYGECDPAKDIFSCEAPVPKAIMGHRIGDSINCQGRTIEILNVSPRMPV